jgi:alpha-galactosidase
MPTAYPWSFSRATGTYEIQAGNGGHSVIHARVAVEIGDQWVKSTDYPKHEISESNIEDALGHSRKITITLSRLPNIPDLAYRLRVYDGRALVSSKLKHNDWNLQR